MFAFFLSKILIQAYYISLFLLLLFAADILDTHVFYIQATSCVCSGDAFDAERHTIQIVGIHFAIDFSYELHVITVSDRLNINFATAC